MTGSEWAAITLVLVVGHLMALFWYYAKKHDWKICERTIYDVPFKDDQIKRELRNSAQIPLHALMLGALLWLGFFGNTGWLSLVLTLVAMILWAEIWHYFSHRAFHLKRLHWIHIEHHRSLLNTPFTALSFSFSEKLIFNFGMLLPFVATDFFVSVNIFGMATWYVGYLIVNSFSHANFEFRPVGYNRNVGKVLTTGTYHSLHHSRYFRNYGLGTRVLDRLFGTEWEDYERLYDRVSTERRPLARLHDRVEAKA